MYGSGSRNPQGEGEGEVKKPEANQRSTGAAAEWTVPIMYGDPYPYPAATGRCAAAA